jgi:hypothetical protein
MIDLPETSSIRSTTRRHNDQATQSWLVSTSQHSLVLRPPITVRPADAAQATPLANVGLMTVSARRIVTMTVGYVPREELPGAEQPR